MALLNPRGDAMQVQHIGYQIRGFYRVAKIGHRWDMNPHAQKRIDILRFWEVHGTAATCDAFKVSRRTLYRWQQTLAQAGGDPAALTPRSRAPKRRRHAVFRREVVDEIRRLRKVRPNIGKLPLSVLIKAWCQTHKCPRPRCLHHRTHHRPGAR
ncbi:helix-turn-helix domain-containing protein [Candidatus Spongiihabitans sp.]|uniref:helix-turn-helix domain-containing protein n=1 Tax=Candidatus Spongiihabitans sp. TaxID=3101308 RepID=UPI003C7CB74B